MTAAYFEDHPTDPDKVILRKPYSTDCPNCEYYRQRAQRWRDEAYKLSGHPLPERGWVGLEQTDMPDGEDPMFDHQYFIAGMVYADKILKEKNT